MKINNKVSSAFTLIELLVVIAIIAILASIALPVFSSVQERGKQTKDMSNGKQIALGLKQFAVDHNGVFPSKKPDVVSTDYDAGATPLGTGDFSNDAFWWLFPTYLTSEDIFSVGGSAWSPNPPNNVLDAPTDTARVNTLAAGECGYEYITSLQGGKKAIVIFVDGSGQVATVNDQTSAVASFVKRPGHAYNISSNTSGTATDPWLAAANLRLPPN